MRIALVNDMPLAIEILRRVVVQSGRHEIAWIAYDGEKAVQMCAVTPPDLILMDLMMPVLDGVEATTRIMQQTPCAILVVTSTISGHAGKTFAAMGAGALDAVCTPTMLADGSIEGSRELLAKIERISRLIQYQRQPSAASVVTSVPETEIYGIKTLVAIGASTGGPPALATVLQGLPRGRGLAVVVVQHIDQQFVPSLAEWLQEQCSLKIVLAAEGQAPTADTVFLACSNDHLILGRDRLFHYVAEPVELPYRPSIDVCFSSLQNSWKSHGCAALLTGMGRDGARGLWQLRHSGWLTIAQEPNTCVVSGMPDAAIELGAAQKICAAQDIAAAIVGTGRKV